MEQPPEARQLSLNTLRHLPSKTLTGFPDPLLRLAAKTLGCLPVSDQKVGFECKLKRFLAGEKLPADNAHFYWNGAFSATEQLAVGGDRETSPVSALCARLDGAPRYLFVDQHYYLPNDIPYECDRMSIAHSLEARSPFLDHCLVAFAARLPAKLRISDGRTKHVLRERNTKRILNRKRQAKLSITHNSVLSLGRY